MERPIPVTVKLEQFAQYIQGDLYSDKLWRTLYATDASPYRKTPLAVILPKNVIDLKKTIAFARKNGLTLTPRTAGTSLAGQVVSEGIVLDFSKYMNQILEVNVEKKWVRVQPGVVLDELNKILSAEGLFFSPETSTANRCMIGGMIGNNSCGLHSLIYGSARDHTIEITALLSDGSEVIFTPLTADAFKEKLLLQNLEGDIYRKLDSILSQPGIIKEINDHFPDPNIPRRNTGYAIDLLLNNSIFGGCNAPFNLCKLICGSEGTLALITEIKLNLIDAPPKHKALICAHFHDLKEVYRANLVALEHLPGAIELMDKKIITLTEGNITQKKNRFFLQGDPDALLFIEFSRSSEDELDLAINKTITALKMEKLGYSFPVVYGSDISKVWNLRKAGLGVLSNLPGDAKPVSVIEDAAVLPQQLPDFINEFELLMDKYHLECVYHAHIATGELHLRPILNLKKEEDVKIFREIGYEMAILVKKYRGSLSGEHGDGLLRSEFIPLMVGERVYQLMREIKEVFDPHNIFNPGKIIDALPMNASLRSPKEHKPQKIETLFDFSDTQGFIRAVEKCNGSGDCRKSKHIGGLMCPSFQATTDERNTTRARANIIREIFTYDKGVNPFKSKEIHDILDLCISCKACKSECPGNVDMTKIKAEYMQHYYDANTIPLRSYAVGFLPRILSLGSYLPTFTNFFTNNPFTSKIIKKGLSFSPHRSIPSLHHITLTRWAQKNLPHLNPKLPIKTIYLFCDEFTNYNDTAIGIAALKLLTSLGYAVRIPKHDISGRTLLSKGLIRKAKSIAEKNISLLFDQISAENPLIGIEPSALLSFKDEYLSLASDHLKDKAKNLSQNCLLIDDFLAQEVRLGRIKPKQFTTNKRDILLHGHCHQKALSTTTSTKEILTIPENYRVKEIPSGCCGMAGSFGYEKEHYELSMKIGNMVLFPHINSSSVETTIAAAGTSCRHQIFDGTGRLALHPIVILWEAFSIHSSL